MLPDVKEVIMRTFRVILVGAVILTAGLLAACSLLPNRAPEAMFVVGYGTVPTDPLIVVLDASGSSDPDGDAIVSYSWVFGDDVTMLDPLDYTASIQTPSIRVRYPVEDTYDVTLLVWDERGASSAPFSRTITLPNLPVKPTL